MLHIIRNGHGDLSWGGHVQLSGCLVPQLSLAATGPLKRKYSPQTPGGGVELRVGNAMTYLLLNYEVNGQMVLCIYGFT